MIRAGKLRQIGELWVPVDGSNWGGDDRFQVVAENPVVRAEKLSESASQRKSAAGLHGADTITYRMWFRADVASGVRIKSGAITLYVLGVENIGGESRELLVTVREQTH